MTTSWAGKTLTWNNRPGHTSGTASTAPNNLKDYNFNVTAIVNAWYNGSPKYGFMISYYNEGTHDLNSLYSSDCGNNTYLPVLTFNYVTGPALSAVTAGVYYIRNQYSGKYIDVNGQYTTDSNIHQWGFHGASCQQWKITHVGNNWYTIRPQHAPNMAMDVYNAATGNDVNIWQCNYNGTDAQKFGFIKNSNGSYRIVTKVTNGAKCLAVQSAVTTDGGNIIQYTYGSQANDNWFLEKVPPNKAYDANYPYEGKGSYTGTAALNWYNNLLSTYSFDLRNETIYTFTGNNCNQFNVEISKFCDKLYTNEQRKSVLNNTIVLAWETAGYASQLIPVIGPGINLTMSLIDTATTLNNMNASSTLNTMNAVHNKINSFIYDSNNNLKSNIKLTISLLKKDPLAGREIKIATNYGDIYLFTLDNTSYEELMIAGCAYCESIATYKVAPKYTYYWE